MTNTNWRKGGAGVEIRWASRETEVGRMIVGATAAGVCWLAFGADDGELEASLRGEYPEAEIVRDEARIGPLLEASAAYLSGVGEAPPIDAPGSEFQQSVWKKLRTIPRGEVWSYKRLASEMGMPTGARAVARANATNPVSLLTPCHRIVREDGGLGGYRWGIERKRRLLEIEQGEFTLRT